MGPRLDRYEIIERIGLGGMGELFLADQLGPAGFRRRCVVKVLRGDLARAEPNAVALFLAEAQVSSSLSHPNLVTVYDFGEAHGSYYLAMEYVIGPTLTALLPGRPHRRRAHAVRRRRDGGARRGARARARARRDAARRPAAAAGAPRHQPLEPAGRRRRRYAPHRLRHRPGERVAEPHQDRQRAGQAELHVARAAARAAARRPQHIFSLGLVFYELLAGQPAFFGDTWEEITLKAARLDIVPLQRLRPDTPRALLDVLGRLVVADRSLRYARPAMLAVDLERFIGEGPAPAAAVAAWVARSSAWWPAKGPRAAPLLEPDREPTEVSRPHLDGEPTGEKNSGLDGPSRTTPTRARSEPDE